MKPMNRVEAPVDFVLVTALEEERTALLAKLPDCQPLPLRPQDIRRFHSGALVFSLCAAQCLNRLSHPTVLSPNP